MKKWMSEFIEEKYKWTAHHHNWGLPQTKSRPVGICFPWFPQVGSQVCSHIPQSFHK